MFRKGLFEFKNQNCQREFNLTLEAGLDIYNQLNKGYTTTKGEITIINHAKSMKWQFWQISLKFVKV